MGIERSIDKKQRETGKEVSQVSHSVCLSVLPNSIHYLPERISVYQFVVYLQAFKDLDALIDKVSK